MSSPALHPAEVTNGSAGVKNNKPVEMSNSEEKDGSSAGSMDETNTTYLNNAPNHGPQESNRALANGTTQPNYESQIAELQEKLQRREQQIEELQETQNKISLLEQEIENERRQRKVFEQERETSRSNLQSFEEHNITVESHLEMIRQIKELQEKCENLNELGEMNEFQIENDEKYLTEYNNNNNSNNNNLNDRKLLITLQQTVVERDNLIIELKEFKQQTINLLRDIRNQVESEIQPSKNNGDNDEKLRSLQKNLNELQNQHKEETDRLKKDIQKLNGTIKTIQNDKIKAEKESKSKESQMKSLRQRINQQQSQMTTHEKELKKQKNEFENKLERVNEEKIDLNNQLTKLQNTLETEKQAWAEERNKRVNLKEENARVINQEKRKVSQQLEKEQEFRINLEHKLQQSKDSVKKKESLISKLNTSLKTYQSQLEIEEKKCQECMNEQKILRRKYEDASSNEKTANEQMLALEGELKDTQLKLNRMTEQNSSLHEAMRKKDNKLKALQEKESEIVKLQNAAKTKENQAQKKLEKAKKIEERLKQKSEYNGKNVGRSQRSFLAKNDPLHEFRNILPFHWLSAILAFLLFVMFCKANL